MRLRDLVADLQGELQSGVDRAERDLAERAEASGTRFRVRTVQVDLPVGVAARENGEDESGSSEELGALDVRPGAGDGRLTFSFVPAAAERPKDRETGASTVAEPGFDPGEVLDSGPDVEPSTAGPIIPEPAEAQLPLRFDPSLPPDLRAGHEEPVESVEGVGSKRADALEGMGVTTVAELAAADPAAVAEELATADAQAERLVARARLMDLGADPQTAEVLVDHEMGLDQLADMEPERLLERIEDGIETRETPVPDDYEPSPETASRIVELARSRRR